MANLGSAAVNLQSMSPGATALDPRDFEARSAANSALASADSPTAVRNHAGPSSFSGAAAYGPEPAAHSSGPTGMSTSQTLAEGSATSVPQAADVEGTANHTGRAQQTAVTEVLQETGAQVHGSNFLFWAIKRLVTMTGSDLAFCFWFPALLALSLAHCTYMALSIHLDELDDCASLDEQVQEEPTIMPPLQPHRELLPPRQPQTQFLPPRQPQTQVLPPQQPRTQVLPPRQPQAQVLPLQQVVPLQQVLPARQPQTQVLPPEQPQAQVLPTSQPQSHIMPAPQPQVQVVPHPPTLDPDHDVHRVITNSGGASQPEVSAHLASDLSHHQEQTASVQRRNPSLPEAAASQEGLQYEGPMPRQAAFRLPRIFRRREAPLMATTSPVELADVCVVCMDAGKDWLCVPCGHLAMCKACSARVKHQTGRCPVCQKKIKQVMQVYKV